MCKNDIIKTIILCSLLFFSCSLNKGTNGDDETPPDAPENLTAAPAINQVSLTWDTTAATDFYQLYWTDDSSTPDENSNLVDSLLVASYTHNSLDYKKTYKYVIRAVNEFGEGDFSAVVSSVPLPPPIPAPTGLSAMADTVSATIILDWDDHAQTGVTYTVHRKKSQDHSDSTIVAKDLTASNYTDDNVSTGLGYLYKVKAVLAAESRESAYCPEVYACTWFIINDTEPNGPTGTLTSDPWYPYVQEGASGYDGIIFQGSYDSSYTAYSPTTRTTLDFDLFKFTLEKGDSITMALVTGTMTGSRDGMVIKICEVYGTSEITVKEFYSAPGTYTYQPFSANYLYAYVRVELPEDLIASGPYNYEIKLQIIRQ
jgi:hypothetical protein